MTWLSLEHLTTSQLMFRPLCGVRAWGRCMTGSRWPAKRMLSGLAQMLDGLDFGCRLTALRHGANVLSSALQYQIAYLETKASFYCYYRIWNFWRQLQLTRTRYVASP